MSDQANSEGITSDAGTGEARGHGRRAVMLGAAAAGVGAVAGMAAGSAGTAMASTDVPGVKGLVSLSRRVTVRLPPSPLNIDQAIRVLESVLGQAGCGQCFSGLDLIFTYENEFIVDAKGVVQPEI